MCLGITAAAVPISKLESPEKLRNSGAIDNLQGVLTNMWFIWIWVWFEQSLMTRYYRSFAISYANIDCPILTLRYLSRWTHRHRSHPIPSRCEVIKKITLSQCEHELSLTFQFGIMFYPLWSKSLLSKKEEKKKIIKQRPRRPDWHRAISEQPGKHKI